MITALLVSRAKEFSPNNETKDFSILCKVAECLEKRGCDVCRFAETEKNFFTALANLQREENSARTAFVKLQGQENSVGTVFANLQGQENSVGTVFANLQGQENFSGTVSADLQIVVGMMRRLKTLLQIEKSGVISFNAAKGIINTATSRELTLSLLENAGVAVPEFWAYDPEDDEMFQCETHLQSLLPAWVKAMRHDGVRQGDVVFVETPLEADTQIIRLVAENVQDIVVTKHINGDLVKVYVVTNRHGEIQFLKWFYPQEQEYTKFGDESHNDVLQHFAFSENDLRKMTERISQTLELQFFGFDAIISEDGKITVIDVNDWPSYSICQNEAAESIARTILADIETY